MSASSLESYITPLYSVRMRDTFGRFFSGASALYSRRYSSAVMCWFKSFMVMFLPTNIDYTPYDPYLDLRTEITIPNGGNQDIQKNIAPPIHPRSFYPPGQTLLIRSGCHLNLWTLKYGNMGCGPCHSSIIIQRFHDCRLYKTRRDISGASINQQSDSSL